VTGGLRWAGLLLVPLFAFALFVSYNFISADPTATPTPTAEPLATDTAVPPTQPPPVVQALAPGTSIIIGGEVRLRGDPSTASAATGTLYDGAPVKVVGVVKGENWLVGSQTWVSSTPSWATDWLQLDDGSFVYSAFVFTLGPDETPPQADTGGAEKWIDVNVSNQTVSAMVGDKAVHVALASTGSSDFPTPLGTHHIEPDGRVVLVDMTASQAGYSPAQAQYDVKRVLFAQYFDRLGNAIHLNYWRPESVYGNTATSHGCVGVQLHDAQYLWLFGAAGMRVEIHE